MKKSKEKDEFRKSPMKVAINSRFLGVAITIFILILTLKSELLFEKIMTAQLVLSIPFWIGAMVSQAKIARMEDFKNYFVINNILFAFAFAFLYNALGLLITTQISLIIGLLFFIVYICIILALLLVGFKKERLLRDLIIILILILGGILPSLGVISF